MEGSYDRVWRATKREGVPSEEYGVFSEVSTVIMISFLAKLTTLPVHMPEKSTNICVLAGSRGYDTLGDCIVFRESISIVTDGEREKPTIS